jgi:hypothetical protein
MVYDIRYTDMDAFDPLDMCEPFPELDENFFLSFCDQPVTDLSEIPLLSVWESLSTDDSDSVLSPGLEPQRTQVSNLPQLFADPEMCEREAQLAKINRETAWMFKTVRQDTGLDRAERVFYLVEHAKRTWLTDLQIIRKITGATDTNRLVVWLDYPQNTRHCDLNEFSISYRDAPKGGLGFYGLVCRSEVFDPRGRLFFTIADIQARYKENYRWNKAEVAQIFRRGDIKTKLETSKQVRDREQKRRKKE